MDEHVSVSGWKGTGENGKDTLLSRTLIVVANPEPESLSHHVAHQIRELLPDDESEIADLYVEGFDPRFNVSDRLVYQCQGTLPVDVQAEQERLERMSNLVLVFPVYWWSMPAMLKGWVDRVFVNGWAFDYDHNGLQPRLGWLTVHLVPVASSDAHAYEKHGYGQALDTQIAHGIIDYCGSRRGLTSFLYESEQPDTLETSRRVTHAATSIAERIRAARP